MKTSALILALLATGCSASAPDPTTTTADAGFYDAPTAAPVDAADGALSTITPDAASDAPPCPGNWIRCDGVCVFSGNLNCGRCGNVCPGASRCCTDGPQTRCSLDCSQP
jgi:hypothetical protein